MAETVKIDIFADSSSIKELKQQLLEARNQLSGLEAGSEGFQNVARRAGELKDQMTDINEQVAIFAGGSKFEQAGTALGQVKDALFNLDFQGASDKAKALTTIISSISFKEATAGLGQLGSTFLSLGKALLTNPLFLIPAAIVGIITSLGLLGPIIDGIKNLFGFLSDAVNEFLVSIGLVSPAIKEVSEEEKAAADAAQAHADAIAKEVTGFKLLINQLSATNAGSKERKNLIKQINEQYGTTLKNIKDEDKFQAQLNTTVENYLKYVKQRILLQSYEVEYAKNLRSRIQLEEKLATLQEEKDSVEKINKRAQAIKDEAHRYRELWIEQDQSTSSGRKLAKQYKEQEIALNYRARAMQSSVVSTVAIDFEIKSLTESLEDNIKVEAELDKKYLEGTKTLNSFNFGIKTTGDEVKKTTSNIADVIKDLDEVIKKTATIFSEPLQAPEIPDEAIDTGIVDEATKEVNQYWANLELGATKSYEGYKTLMQERMEEEIRITNATGAEADLIRQKYANKEIERQRAVSDARLQIATDSLSLISNVTELFAGKSEKDAEKAFNVNKAVGIAQATIQTYQAAQAAYLSQLSIPSPDAPVRAAIAAGVAVAAGIANIAKIAQTQYKGSTPSGGNSFANAGTVTTPAQPSFQLFGTAGQANNVNAGTGQQVQTINVNASVSVDQITDTQKKLVQINQSKTL